MTFQELFKSGFLDNMTEFSFTDMLVGVGLAFAIGLFIFFVYKKTYRGVMFSPGFGVTLVVITMITTVLIMAVTSNILLSLGMVGALSIVRFRTAIKEPMDIAFLFWSIAAGIVIAAGLLPLAVFGSIAIGVVMMVFVSGRPRSKPYMLMLRLSDSETEKCAEKYIDENAKKAVLKSKSVSAGVIELNYEVRLTDGNTDFINTLAEMPGVSSAVFVSYNGDYMG